MDDAIIMSPPKLSKGRKWATLAVLLFGQFVVSIDMTVLTVALPDITSDLRPTSDQQLWMVDAYSLVLTSLLVSMSTLSDRWGRKRMLLAGFLLFGIVSALVLAASTPQQVIGIRVLMGTASAMIMPTTISTIRSVFLDPKERAFALAAWSSIAGLGSVAGPIVGGFLVEHFSWHAAFLVNVPLMAIGLVVGAAAVPEIRVKHPGHWDALGAAMTLGGMVGVMWGIKHIAAVMAVDAAGAAALVIGFALLAAFVRRCLRSEHPPHRGVAVSQQALYGGHALRGRARVRHGLAHVPDVAMVSARRRFESARGGAVARSHGRHQRVRGIRRRAARA